MRWLGLAIIVGAVVLAALPVAANDVPGGDQVSRQDQAENSNDHQGHGQTNLLQ